jgi:hypothetical protein
MNFVKQKLLELKIGLALLLNYVSSFLKEKTYLGEKYSEDCVEPFPALAEDASNHGQKLPDEKWTLRIITKINNSSVETTNSDSTSSVDGAVTKEQVTDYYEDVILHYAKERGCKRPKLLRCKPYTNDIRQAMVFSSSNKDAPLEDVAEELGILLYADNRSVWVLPAMFGCPQNNHQWYTFTREGKIKTCE